MKTTAVRDRLIENNKKINWIPESIGEGRMGNFLENVIDWGLSRREALLGTPLPVWECALIATQTTPWAAVRSCRKCAPDTPRGHRAAQAHASTR